MKLLVCLVGALLLAGTVCADPFATKTTDDSAEGRELRPDEHDDHHQDVWNHVREWWQRGRDTADFWIDAAQGSAADDEHRQLQTNDHQSGGRVVMGRGRVVGGGVSGTGGAGDATETTRCVAERSTSRNTRPLVCTR
ncbi:unnamed protein product [Vitrella brassicaformis CCMP3155]|uniref:Uncharacterized protein n=1 Tax=Vitrella brassicaformis (strain CCMP3155) TaxID=1169540 RepID=A0A0G4GT57_VITBC|nr:unnamed protein product [Vitrella brassicaformis CCMP3155]|eukprot:CEM33876.1 unnamed protein product [Vitrella brassicaformis CCMP3155]